MLDNIVYALSHVESSMLGEKRIVASPRKVMLSVERYVTKFGLARQQLPLWSLRWNHWKLIDMLTLFISCYLSL